jgi:hypothetical protein
MITRFAFTVTGRDPRMAMRASRGASHHEHPWAMTSCGYQEDLYSWPPPALIFTSMLH